MKRKRIGLSYRQPMRSLGVALLVFLSALLCPSCQRSAPPPLSDGGQIEFIGDRFDDLYPLFLLRRLKPGPKAALWQSRYRGKWVRWTGTLVSFTANGVAIKQLRQTVTFDVSLWLPMADRARLASRVRPGERVTYIGQLDSYDDIFRTLYLVHGTLLDADAGSHD